MSDNRINAEIDYMAGMKYKDIAEKYGVTLNTVKSWKKRYEWNREGAHKNKRVHTKKEVQPRKIIEQEISKLEDAGLTEKQRLFCLYYIKSFNATMAAIKAGYSKDTAHVIGHENLRKPKIANEIRRLKGTMHQDIFVDAMDVLNKYIKIAFADITDYVDFGRKKEIVKEEVGTNNEGEPILEEKEYEYNYVHFKNAVDVDGTVISEVKQGKDGVSIRLADKMKALEKLEKYFDLIPDTWKRKIEEEKLAMQKRKIEEPDEGDTEDDGFIDALNAQASEVWNDDDQED
ncbi:terminase small subunit [Desulfuribacillus stibiiarsenatis]|uniref:terminase small subunit n=1 Tax=Desulfuribacillus stibiiarsenatis TaxID=1390249 RepID=UPI000A5D5A27|nr:terminase small subunit [Desulfuribacillus stibiiarsenatis]